MLFADSTQYTMKAEKRRIVKMEYSAKRLFRLISAMALLLLGCCAVTGCTGNGGEETSATGTQHVEESGEPTGSDQHTETEKNEIG